MRKVCAARAIVCLALACPIAALAQSYPSKPVRLIVPFAAGGTFDTVGRVVAQQLSDLWRSQVVVDNRPGGATIIATEIVAKAQPDGYTLYLSPNALAANPALHKKLPYDARTDLTPIALVAAQPMALGAHPTFRASNVSQLIEMAKAKPGDLSYGSAGVGSGGHLAGEIFKSMAGIKILHVSYKGGNLSMLDVIANQIPLVMTGLPNLLPQARAGKIKILAITDAQRSPVAPDIPTIGETVRGYSFRNWFGLIAPAGTPREIVAKLNSDVNDVLGNGRIRTQLQNQGFIVIGGTPGEFAQTIREDTEKFGRVLREAGIRSS